MSTAVVGWEAWFNKQPKRAEGVDNPFNPDEVDYDEKYQRPNMSHFWAFVVWNADQKKVQLWQVSQRSILTGLWTLLQAEEWGDPRSYGIIVTKKKNGTKTEYQVNGVPPKPLTEEIKKAYATTTIKLEKIFEEHAEDGDAPIVAAGGNDF